MATLNTPENKGMPEDPGGMPDETASFVLDAFTQLGNDDVASIPSEGNSEQSSDGGQDNSGQVPAEPAQPGNTASGENIREVPPPVPASPQQQVPAPVQGQQPASQPQPVAQPVTQQGEVQVNSFEVLQQELMKNEEVFTNALAEQVYKISEQDLNELMSGNPQAISKALAKVHVQSTSTVMRTLAQQLPVMVHGLLQAQKTNSAREQAFWDSNKHLDPVKHRDVVVQSVRAYRATNPNADAATMNKMVGVLAAMQLGLPVGQQQAQAPAQSRPQTPGPVVRQVAPPNYSPVGVNQPGGNGHAQPAANEWDRMASLIHAEDQGAFDV